MPSKENLKRKDPPQGGGRQGRDPKRSKMQESRKILAQPGYKILNESGELDVGSFVKSRQFEIEALEQGMKKSKHGLSTRAFQEVPRQLRRRTASHNVKKVPRRLRVRAAKEIKEDNTPTGSERKKKSTTKQHIRRETAEKAARIGAQAKKKREALAKSQEMDAQRLAEEADDHAFEDAQESSTLNQCNEASSAIQPIHGPQTKRDVLARGPKPVTKFRKRQKDKTWLPTHIYHAKRAHMTPPSEPLWRFAIPINPTEKVYRTTHRAATLRGCVAWDMSYMSTIMLEGVEHGLLGVLRRMGVPTGYSEGKKGEKWRQGLRSWTGWLKEANDKGSWITRVMLVWCADKQPLLANLGDEETEVEPARRRVLLRTHPAGFLQLWTEILRVAKEQRPAVKIEDLRFDIGSIEIEGPQANETLAGILHELPRKRLGEQHSSGMNWPSFAKTEAGSLANGALLNLNLMDPRLRHPPRTVSIANASEDQVMKLMMDWPGDDDKVSGLLYDRDARFASCTLQSSQKAINRRKGDAGPGEYPPQLSSDPQIPALLCATQSDDGKFRQSTWTLMLPWSWILPFWNSLVYYPLSTGGNPRIGGLDEKRQLCFEQDVPWFPADYPGTQAGWNWELRQQVKRLQEWKKRPKAKRVEWSSIDLGRGKKGELGRGWACDWEYLFGLRVADDDTTSASDLVQSRELARQERDDGKSGRQIDVPEGVTHVFADHLADTNYLPPERALITVNLKLVHRGVPTTCARIYRLPTSDERLRDQWQELLKLKSGKNSLSKLQGLSQQKPSPGADNKSTHASQYPDVPEEADLIGFVTTGNFNLAEGRGTGIGSIAINKVWSDAAAGQLERRKQGVCIIREAGTSVGRLAEWTAV